MPKSELQMCPQLVKASAALNAMDEAHARDNASRVEGLRLANERAEEDRHHIEKLKAEVKRLEFTDHGHRTEIANLKKHGDPLRQIELDEVTDDCNANAEIITKLEAERDGLRITASRLVVAHGEPGEELTRMVERLARYNASRVEGLRIANERAQEFESERDDAQRALTTARRNINRINDGARVLIQASANETLEDACRNRVASISRLVTERDTEREENSKLRKELHGIRNEYCGPVMELEMAKAACVGLGMDKGGDVAEFVTSMGLGSLYKLSLKLTRERDSALAVSEERKTELHLVKSRCISRGMDPSTDVESYIDALCDTMDRVHVEKEKAERFSARLKRRVDRQDEKLQKIAKVVG